MARTDAKLHFTRESIRKVLTMTYGLSESQVDRFFISQEFRPSIAEISVSVLNGLLARGVSTEAAPKIAVEVAASLQRELDSLKVP